MTICWISWMPSTFAEAACETVGAAGRGLQNSAIASTAAIGIEMIYGRVMNFTIPPAGIG
jgi:hypothetical protein